MAIVTMNPVIILVSLHMVCDAYKILLVFPVPTSSHTNLGEGYVRHLLKAGHEITYITPIPIKNHPKALRQIDVSSNFPLFPIDFLDLSVMIRNNEKSPGRLPAVLYTMFGIANGTLLHENVQKLINDPKEDFDVVIAEWMFSELYSGLGPVFNCSLIWFSSLEPHLLVLSLMEEVPNPAYVPHWASTFVPPLTFRQRASELWAYIIVYYHKWLLSFNEVLLYERAYAVATAKRGRRLPPLSEAKYSASLMLGNSHVSLGEAVSLPQSYKPIAGYHIEESVKPLPADLQNLMDSSTDGVIYFSMGSTVRAKSLPMELKRRLLDVFKGLKQTMIWKLEEEPVGLPKNVFVVNFAPQQSILAHPNCVLFITHCGLLSITEAIHFGVPIIGIPIFADQYINVGRSIQKGFGKRVDLRYDIPERLQIAIEEILRNSSYREKAKLLSKIYHDRPVSPGSELVHWVEHVVKTRGAPHLRSPALMLPWYQKMYLDLLFFICSCILLMLYLSLMLYRFVVSNKIKLNSAAKKLL